MESMSGRSKARAGFRAGVLGALAMLTVLLLARLMAGVVTPIEVAVDRLIPRLPLSWFEAGLDLFGGYAKPLLFAGALAATVLLGGLGGMLFVRMRETARARTVALTLGIVLALLLTLLPAAGQGLFGGRSDGGIWITIAAYLVAYVIYGATLVLSRTQREDGLKDAGARLPRRAFVGGGVRGVTLLLLGAAGLTAAVRLLEKLTVTDVRADVTGMPPPFTPNETFYTVSKNAIDPEVDASRWKLSLGGLVERPYELTIEQLHSLPPQEQGQTLECISNPVGGNLIGNASWKGVPLRALLERAGVRPETRDIKLTCADGYTESIPVEKAMEPGVLLAYEMNGEPLSAKHGAPARLLVPNIFGMKNTKWVQKVEAVNEDYQGYWQKQGWSDTATIVTMSQLRVPAKGARLRVGEPVTVGGIAFAGSRGISRVEWSADGGKNWQEGRLLGFIAPFSWRLWEADWKPTQAGRAELVVRATDGNGNTQTANSRPTLPDGATGYHSIEVEVA